METINFLDDLDKMYDIMEMEKDEFLAFYSYISEEEYNNTMSCITPKTLRISSVITTDEIREMFKYNKEVIENLANLMKKAKEIDIKEILGQHTWNVGGDQLRRRVAKWVGKNLTPNQLEDFRKLCSNSLTQHK